MVPECPDCGMNKEKDWWEYCPHCGYFYNIHNKDIGEKYNCPKCNLIMIKQKTGEDFPHKFVYLCEGCKSTFVPYDPK